MISNQHRTNSNFQLKYFLAGSCTTPDGAWLLLYNQKIDVETKLKLAKSQSLKTKAKKISLDRALVLSTDEVERLMIQSQIDEIDAFEYTSKMNFAGAEKELEAIISLMDEIKPQCKYADLPILEAAEAAQREEWLGEIKKRVENFLLTSGTIPHDHFETMRCHPDFEEKIVPFIQDFTKRLEIATQSGNGLMALNSVSNILALEDKT